MIHILNGDSLASQFPKTISGQFIIARECLIEGEIAGNSLVEIVESRMRFFEKIYAVSKEEYQQKTISEFEKIKSIDTQTSINLWFEDDLFCQANLWFVAYFLCQIDNTENVYLIRPKDNLEYGFGGMSKQDLENAYQNKQKITPKLLKEFSQMWKNYQANNLDEMLEIAQRNHTKLPFLIDAVKAHSDRVLHNRPQKALKKIMKELQSTDFGTVFRTFHKQESIYGFGDLQVKRIFDEILKGNKA
jgi:hypothetical protein